MVKAVSRKTELLKGAKEVIPLALGAAVYGLAFGLLATQAHMDALDVGLMGTLVFAGAAQIVAVERLIAGAGAFVAIVAGIALNLRLLLMTASIRDLYAGKPTWQLMLGAHLTVDENWALMLSRRAQGERVGYWYFIGAGLTVISAWVVSTVVGASFAAALPEPKAIGMDFAFIAAFIAIARSMWRGNTDLLPWCVSFILVVVTMTTGMLTASWALIAGGLIGSITAGVRR